MPLIATEGESKPKQLPPAGTHAARCYSVIDLGTQTANFAGEEKKQHKVRISWELPEERAVFSEDKGAQPFVLHKEYSLSLYEKANLRHDLESWRGKPFTAEELKGFDIFNLLGVPCLISVIHKPSKDGSKTYANIATVAKLPKSMTCPEQINETTRYEVSNGRTTNFQSLPPWLQEKIMQCDEWGEEPATQERETDEEGDSVIPF